MATEQSYNEKDLLIRIAEGNEGAFTMLVDKYSPFLYTFILRITGDRWLAEEVVQDSFVKIWLARETLGHVEYFKAFLFSVSKNVALKALQKVLKEGERQVAWRQFYENAVQEQPSAEPALLLIDQAIANLPPQQLKAWTLCRKQGLSYQDAAAELGISRETVKKHLQAAHQSILKYVEARWTTLFFAIICWIK